MRTWAALLVVLLAVILLPFFLFERPVNEWAAQIAASKESEWRVGFFLVALLALDIVLPVPSSVVATAAGALLGFSLGALVTWTGMTAGCLAGYALAARAGRCAAGRLLGPAELDRISKASARFGDWNVVLCRAVPVLAEASVFFAGITRMPFRRFAILSTAGNLGIALVYAAVGAWSARIESFLLAFAGAILLPLAAMRVVRR